MSRLNSKINSYPLEKGMQMDDQYTFPWVETGSEPQTTTANWLMSTNGPIASYEGCGGGAGSSYWLFNTARRYRMNISGSIGAGFADQSYSLGFWFRLNDFTYTSNTGASIFGVLSVATAAGFTLGVATNAPGLPEYEVFYIQYTNTSGATATVLISDPDQPAGNDALIRNKWYYFAMVRNSLNDVNIYLNGVYRFSITDFRAPTAAPSAVLFGNNASVGIAPTYLNYNMSNYYVTTPAAIGPTQVVEIWQAGKTMNTPIKHWNGTSWATATDKKRWDGNIWHEINAQEWNGSSWVTL